jgi:hypothetical protein
MGFLDKMKDAAAQVATQAQQVTDRARGDSAAAAEVVPAPGAGELAPAPVPAPQVQSAEISGPRPLFEVVSHIEGKNAKVRLWPDRLEWERARGVSAGKLTAAALTVGTSLLVTGVKGGKDAFDMIWLKHVTNVSNRKDGMLYHLVEVQASSGAATNTVGFRVTREHAANFRAAILDAVSALDAENRPSMNVTLTNNIPPAPVPVSALPPEPDVHAQLMQLASLRDAGIVTEEEFATKKADLLSRM